MVKQYPFPHLVIYDAIPERFAEILTNNFIIQSFDLNANNKRLDISASEASTNNALIDEWKEFIKFHSSSDFFLQAIKIFEDYLGGYNKLSNINLKNARIGVRNLDSFKYKDILMDAQISINTPVNYSTSVRKVHTDNINKLFSSLFYLRQPNDDSVGGNLQLCEWKNLYTEKKKIRLYKEGLDESHYNVVKEIKYSNNLAVIFLNSINALHCVTPREPTIHPRIFVNIISETSFDLFNHHPFFKRKVIKLMNKIRKLRRAILVCLK